MGAPSAKTPMTSPYSEAQWLQIDALGHQVDQQLQRLEVGLMVGGEPTFVSAHDLESPQWRIAALGEEKRAIAGQLLQHLQQQFGGVGSLRHYGIGKQYPGEPGPRWALGCYWRDDRQPIWHQPDLQAGDGKACGHTVSDLQSLCRALLNQLGLPPDSAIPAYEPTSQQLAGYVIPLLLVQRSGQIGWSTCEWQLPGGRLQLLGGEAVIGLRLPLQELPLPDDLEAEALVPFSADLSPKLTGLQSAPNSIRVALCLEVRQGTIHLFMPPIRSSRPYLDAIAAIEVAAQETGLAVAISGYPPPIHEGIRGFQITPDPGVIEVNIHPVDNWQNLAHLNKILYETARQCGLNSQKYLLDGRLVSTGGGAHITIGGRTVESSPLLRRPDLLRSLISYWQNHPSLSYLFSDLFIGPTSQAPRIDEARHEGLYELETVFQSLQPHQDLPPSLVDRLLRNLLIDVTGNTHRTALCIDKLFPLDNPRNQLGILEFRSFSMPPHEHLRLLQLLLVQALIAWFWQEPYRANLIRWGTTLHDRFLLPHHLQVDLQSVLMDLRLAGYEFQPDWFQPFFAFRFPIYGVIACETEDGREVGVELRHAIEPWHVLGEEATSSGLARFVDSSMERLQVRVWGLETMLSQAHPTARYGVICNGHPLPLHQTDTPGEWVSGVRYRAYGLMAMLHPAIAPHLPLSFHLVDYHHQQVLASCIYHGVSPDGSSYAHLPTSPAEACQRMEERFIPRSNQRVDLPSSPPVYNPEYPLTLDLRRVSHPSG